MGYAEKNLIAGETVVFKTRLHEITLLPAVVFGLFPLIGAIALGVSGYGGWAVFLVLVALVFGSSPILNYVFSDFAVTNKRILLKHGFFRTRSFELILQKVESIGVDQGIGGRIFGYGGIVVIGTGGSREIFNDISEPIAFRRAVQEQIEIRTTSSGLAHVAEEWAPHEHLHR
jgi:uncharacterized membrane protein YdbT with pleckstrin-like domain